MVASDLDKIAKGRTKARAYFCYLFSANLPNKISEVSQSMIVPQLLAIKEKLRNCESAYLLDHQGKQVTPTYLPNGKEDIKGKGVIRSERAYYYRAVREKRCILTDPYPSLISGDLTVTASQPIYDDKEELKYVACLDLPVDEVLAASQMNKYDSAFTNFFKFSYICFAFALTAVALLLFVHGIQNFFIKDISMSHLSIDEMFKATILLTLSLAIFDLVKTLIEEEVLGQHKEYNVSGPHKTMVKFLGSIIIALSIEALMLVFKFAITDPEHLMNAMYIVAGVAMLIVSLAIYIKYTRNDGETDN